MKNMILDLFRPAEKPKPADLAAFEEAREKQVSRTKKVTEQADQLETMLRDMQRTIVPKKKKVKT